MNNWWLLGLLIVGLGVVGCPPPVNPPDDEEGEVEEGEGDGGDGVLRIGGVTATFERDFVTATFGALSSVAAFNRVVGESLEGDVPPLDSCRVDGVDGEKGSGATPLRAGTPGFLNVGFQQAELREIPAGPGEDGWVYRQDPAFLEAVSVGQQFTVEFPAGPDVPAFELGSVVVAAPIFSQPAIQQDAQGPIVSIDFLGDLGLVWNDADAADYVVVRIIVTTPTEEDGNVTESCTCAMEDDGQFTIPVETLEELGFVEAESSYTFQAQRVAVEELELEIEDGDETETAVVELVSVGSLVVSGE